MRPSSKTTPVSRSNSKRSAKAIDLQLTASIRPNRQHPLAALSHRERAKQGQLAMANVLAAIARRLK